MSKEVKADQQISKSNVNDNSYCRALDHINSLRPKSSDYLPIKDTLDGASLLSITRCNNSYTQIQMNTTNHTQIDTSMVNSNSNIRKHINKLIFTIVAMLGFVLAPSSNLVAQEISCISQAKDTFYINSVVDATSYAWILPSGATTTVPAVAPNDTMVVVDWSGASVGLDSIGVAALGCENSDTLWMHVNITGCVPFAEPDAFTTNEDTDIIGATVVTNDSLSVDGGHTYNVSCASICSSTSNGTLTFGTDGTFDYDPDDNFIGRDTFIYQICDATPDCDTAMVVITVDPVNDPPVVDNETHTINEDETAVGDLTNTGDSDPDGTALTATTTPVDDANNGTIVIAADGSYTYTPDADFNGLDTVVVEICDAGTPGTECVNDTIFITVNPVNDPPVVDNETHTINEDETAVGDLTNTGDADPDGTALTATTTPVDDANNGTIVIAADGSYTYTPDADFNGLDTVVVEICDAGTPGTECVNDTIFITVNPVNDPPVVDNETHSINEDETAVGDLTNTGDADPDGTALTATTTPVDDANNGTIVIAADGSYTYTPDADFNGLDTVVVEICDAGTPGTECINDTIFITVNPVNDPPVVDNETHSINEDETAVGDLTNTGDADPDGTALTATTTPVDDANNGTIVIAADGSYTYTPDADFNGLDTVVVEICDAGTPGTECVNDTIFITINPVNDPPSQGNESISTLEDVAYIAVDLDINNVDPEGDVLALTIPATTEQGGTIVNNNDGTVDYTPALNFNGLDTMVYLLCDPSFACVSDTLFITVVGENDPPVAVDDTKTTTEDTPVTIVVATGDSDVDGNIVPTSVYTTGVLQPTNGSIVIEANGDITYTPNPEFNGTDSFEYIICDDGTPIPAKCDTALVTITIDPVNDGPITNADEGTTQEDTPITLALTTNDTDIDGNLDPTTVTTVCTDCADPTNGTLTNNNDGTITYTPNPDFSGIDTYTYQVCDTDGLCDTAIVTITIDPVNDPPVAQDDSDTTDEDVAVTLDLASNDSDVDGNLDPATVAILNTPPLAQGSVVNNGDGTIEFIPAPGFNGTVDQFEYQICDDEGLCTTAFVDITVDPVNDNPVASNDAETTPEETPVTIDVQGNDNDPDGDPLTTTVTVDPTNGTASVNPDGTIEYTPNPDFVGQDVLTYQVCDAGGLCDDATVTIDVSPVNDPPVAVDDSNSTSEEVPVTFNLAANDSDIENNLDPASLTLLSLPLPSEGTVVNNGDGSITFTPAEDFNGTVTQFEYQICDTDNSCTTAFVDIDVTPVNDPPVAFDDAEATPMNTPVAISVQDNDEDPDGDLLTSNVLTNPSNGTVAVVGDELFYTPNTNFVGTDTLTYEVCDPSGLCDDAQVIVVINGTNVPPVAVDDMTSTPEDITVTLDLSFNDTDADGNLIPSTATLVTLPPAEQGSVINNGDGTIDFIPAPNFNGTVDPFDYQICDLFNDCVTATIYIDVTPDNDTPVALNDSETTPEDTPVLIDIQGNDSDPDNDPLTTSVLTNPANGTLNIEPDGSITYTPNPEYNGTDVFTYEVCDPSGACDEATVDVTIVPTNDTPIAVDDADTTPEDTPVIADVQSNDNDPDNDPLTSAIVTTPTNGTVAVLPDGTIEYTPAPDFTGQDTYEYSVCDPSGACDTASVVIDITPVTDNPVANNDNETTSEDTPVTIDLAVNDSDADGNLSPASITLVSLPPVTQGTVINNADGTIDFVPAPNFTGSVDPFDYKICDTEGACTNATVFINVTPTNDPPVALDNSDITPIDTPVTVDVQSNDSDPDGDVLTTSLVTTPANGTVTVINGDSITYVPDAGFTGTDTFDYEVCDASGACDQATVTIDVPGIPNNPPVAGDETETTPEDTPVLVDLANDDTDVDGNLDPASASLLTSPPATQGTVVNNGDGTITFTPAPGFNGAVSPFDYQICDDSGDCDIATINITVDPVNDPPLALDDSKTTDEDTPVIIAVQNNDSDPDGESLTTTLVTTDPTNGDAVINPDGTITYTPDPDFNGTDVFEYNVCDPSGVCDIAEVTVTVNPANDTPIATNDTESTPEDTPVTVDLATNDSDVDGNLSASSLVLLTTPPSTQGTVVNNGDGTIDFIPAQNFNGPVDQFEYQICDSNGECATAFVDITVSPTNDGPVAIDDVATTPEETLVTVDLASNDTDIDGNLDPTTVSLLTFPSASEGTVTNNNDGTIDFLPADDFNGIVEFDYQICDADNLCITATAIITVTPTNDPPVAVDDADTTPEDTPVTVAIVSPNDTDIDGDQLSILEITKAPLFGTVTIDNNDNVTYTPNENYTGTDVFSYAISDGNGGLDTAQVVITITPTNDAPVANADVTSTNEDTPVTLALTSNDIDVDGNLDPTTVTTICADCADPTNGTLTNNNDGTITYTPNSDFSGIDSYTYQVCDTDGICDTAIVTITIDPVNDPPVAQDDSDTTDEDVAVTLDLASNDSDVDGNLDPATVAILNTPPLAQGSVVNNGDGTIEFIPAPGFNGTVDQFEYQICDDEGLCTTAFVDITVDPVNDNPVASNDAETTPEETPVTIDVQGNDNDPDGDLLTTTVTVDPTNGTASVNPDGTIEYTPNPNFVGQDVLTYQVCDAGGLCDDATVTIDVSPVNDPPVAVDDSNSTSEEVPVTFNLAANDSDIENNLDPASLTLLSLPLPSEGTVVNNGDGSITFTPAEDFNGDITHFEYEICDTDNSCTTAFVDINVTPVNDPPVAFDDAEATPMNTPVAISVQDNDEDPDGDVLTTTVLTNPSNGTVAVVGDELFYTPDNNFVGTDTITYEVCDPSGLCDDAQVIVVINGTNVPPVAVDDMTSTPEDITVTLDLSFNDTDADGNLIPPTATLVTLPPAEQGSVINNGDGTIDFIPAPNFNGTVDPFDYQICDLFNDCATATIYIDVTPDNDTPVALNDSETTPEDTPVLIDIQGNDSDPDNDPLTTSVLTNPANGTLNIEPDGSITYTPNPEYNGTDVFTYEVCDPSGACDEATVDVTIVPTNDTPIAVDDADTTPEDTPVIVAVQGNDNDSDNDPLTSAIVTTPTNGTVAVLPDGTIEYTPAPDFTGQDTYEYSVCDPSGACDTASVVIDITPVADNPVAHNDNETTPEDTPVTVDLAINDTDSDGNLSPASITLVSLPPATQGTVVNNADGTIDFIPAPNFTGTVDPFDYKICDTEGACTNATVFINVTPTNDPPVALDNSDITPIDTPVTVDVQSNDSDPDGDVLTTSLVTTPANGTVTVINGDSITYVPNAGFTGTDTFDYEVCDASGACDQATVTIDVPGIPNNPPVAGDETETTPEDTPVLVDLANDDTDVDGNLDPASASLLTSPPATQGTVVNNGDGTITFTPAPGFSGPVTPFDYQICDTSGDCDIATINITVDPVNDPPLALDDSKTTEEDTPVIIAVQNNDSDPDGESLTTTLVTTDPTNGDAVINPDGTITYTPDPDFNGTDVFEYNVCDPSGVCDIAEVTVTVNPANDTPIATNDTESTPEDTPVTVDLATNDSDVDGNLSASSLVLLTTPPSTQGTVVNNGDGTIDFIPAQNFNGPVDQFEYQICDSNGECATAFVDITVSPTNDGPVAIDDVATTPEETLVTVDLASNDTDIDGNLDPTTVSLLTFPSASEGTVTNNNDGTIDFLPANDFNGIVEFDYQICDADNLCITATAIITVTPTNDPPVAVDDADTTPEDTPVTVAIVSPNDTDIDGDQLSILEITTQPSHGTVSIDDHNEITYTPNPQYNGEDSFFYAVSDGNGGLDTAEVVITIIPVNDPPVANVDNSTTPEDTPVDILVAFNDTDIDGNLDPASANNTCADCTDPVNGTVASNPDGTFTYTPNPGYNGDDSYIYQICDTDGACDTAYVYITVDPVNDPPVAVDDADTTPEDTPVTLAIVSPNDTDADGDALSIQAITQQPTNGTVNVDDNDNITYTPDPNFVGNDTLYYEVSDGNGGTDIAEVVITVTPVNDLPIANGDVGTTQEDTPVTIAVLANDSDIEGIDPNTLAITGTPPAEQGIVTINPDGTVTFTPAPDFNGPVDPIEYQICDFDGACAVALIDISVLPSNDPPVAQDDDATTPEDTPITGINLASNDSDPDGNLDPTSLTFLTPISSAQGVLVNNNDGTVDFIPAPDFNGDVDPIDYRICDLDGVCTEATLNIEVTPVNDPPVANDNGAITPEETLVNINVINNDTDPDDNLDPTSVDIVGVVSNGTAIPLPDGTIDYTPNPGFNGVETFEYIICDTEGSCDQATVTVTINGVNDIPVAVDDSDVTLEDIPVTIDILANDSDQDDNLDLSSVVFITSPDPTTEGVIVYNNDGTITFTPAAGYNGTVTPFDYQVCDLVGECDTATVYIQVDPVADPPVASNDGVRTPENTPINIDVQLNDSDDDGDELITSIANPPSNGTVVVLPDGRVDYTPAIGFNGPDSFVYKVCDPSGLCDTATVTVDVTPVNDPPVAVDNAAMTDEDTPVNIEIVSNDIDPDGDLLIVSAIIVDPTHGTASIAPDGTINYVPNADFNGTDQLEYVVCDPSNACDTATVTIDILPTVDLPVALDDTEETPEDTPITIDISANDTDADGNLAPASVVLNSLPLASEGSVINHGDGTITFEPAHDFVGPVTPFDYTICDTDNHCTTATVNITVTPENDAPIAHNDSEVTPENTPVGVPVLDNDADPDNDPLTVSVTSDPSNGSATVVNGEILYVPNNGFVGIDTLEYQICDPSGLCDEAQVIIEINGTNEPPVAVDDNFTTPEDQPGTFDLVSTNDSDPDDNLDPTTLTLLSLPDPSQGTVINNGDGTITFIPSADNTGVVDPFDYQVCDTNGECAIATVTIEITPPANDEPIALDDAKTTTEDTPVVIDVLTNDDDVDGDPLVVAEVSAPAHGTIAVNPDGTVTYSPDPEFEGTDVFEYSVCDPSGACDTAKVDIVVTPVSDTPVAVDDSESTPEDIPVTLNLAFNDSDADGDLQASSVTLISTPPASQGSVVNNGDGTITFLPAADFNGPVDPFTYNICDANNQCTTADVFIDVIPQNDAPVAQNDAYTTDEDVAIILDPLANDTDPENDPLTVNIISAPENGVATLNPDGTINYEPNPGFGGYDIIVYEICDAAGTCDKAEIDLTIIPVNDPVVAHDDAAVTDEDVAVTFDIAGNDQDADGNIDPTSITILTTVNPEQGELMVNSDGTVTFNPAPDFNGQVDLIDYQICDLDGACAIATIDIYVNPKPDAPVAENDNGTTPEETPLTLVLSDNDLDIDGDLNPASLTLINTPPLEQGRVINLNDGSIEFIPAPGFNGQVDKFEYSICDTKGECATAVVDITVTPVNDPPVAVDDYATTNQDEPITFDIITNDKDEESAIDLASADIVDPNVAQGTIVYNGDGIVTFTPAPGFSGDVDPFDYEICDIEGVCATATIFIDVIPVDVVVEMNPPVAQDNVASTPEETPITINLTMNDSDPDGNLNPSTLTFIDPPLEQGTIVDHGDGTITFTPAPDFNGVVSFEYTICDTDGFCDTAQVEITVDPVNDEPIALDDAADTDEGSPVDIPVAGNDQDPDGDPLQITILDLPENGVANVTPSGEIQYTPYPGFSGDDVITYVACDPLGACDTAEVVVTVHPVNHDPDAVDDAVTTLEDTPINIAPLDNDKDQDGDPIQPQILTYPENGTIAVNPDGTIDYRPDPEFSGTDVIEYVICDPFNACDTAEIVITVIPDNDPPVALNDTETTEEDTPVTLDLVANDSDVDGDLIPETLKLLGLPSPEQGSVVNHGDGTITFVPAPDFTGQVDLFNYEVCDAAGICATATVDIFVLPIPEAPVASDDSGITPKNTPVSLDILSNDNDPDGDPLTVQIIDQPLNGTVEIIDGEAIYTPNQDFVGTDIFIYKICDPSGACDQAQVIVEVEGTNAAPMASDDSIDVPEDEPVTADLFANDTDVDDNLDPGSLEIISPIDPTQGSLVNNGDGTVTFTPAKDYTGPIDPIEYTICDTAGECDTAIVTFTITPPVNDPPVALNDSKTILEDETVSIPVLSNDSDPDGDELTVSIVTDPVNGTVEIVDGELVYTPNPGFSGTDVIVYKVCDPLGFCDEAEVLVNVIPVNDPPLAVDDYESTLEDTPVRFEITANDTDFEGDIDPTSFEFISYPSQGVVVDMGDGSIIFFPNPQFNGVVDPFEYVICDFTGACDTATIFIDVIPVNDPPIVVVNTEVTDENTPITIDILANDSDVDGFIDPTSVELTNLPPATQGEIVYNDDGTITFIPADHFDGIVDPITYTACDNEGACATSTINITVINTDSDDDSILDIVECDGTFCPDTDGDGTPDYLDTDSDNDGAPDEVECPSYDGSVVSCDVDNNGIPDHLDCFDANIQLSSNSPVCEGAEIQLTSTSDVDDAAYAWRIAGSNEVISTVANPVFTAEATTTFELTITSNSCYNNTVETITVDVNPTPQITISSTAGVICDGGTVQLETIVTGGTNWTYAWNGPAGFSSIAANPTIANANVSNNGTYTVEVTNEFGCVKSASVNVDNIVSTPSKPTVVSNSPVCANGEIVLTAIDDFVGTTIEYIWTNSTGAIVGNTASLVIDAENPLAAAPFFLQVIADGCSSELSDPVTIEITPLPQAFATGNTAICFGSELNLMANSDMGDAATYAWFDIAPDALPAPDPISIERNPSIGGLAVGTHTLYMKASLNGCSADAYASLTVTVHGIPAFELAATSAVQCIGEEISFNAPEVEGASYDWVGPNGFSSTLANPVIPSANSDDDGTYYLTIAVNGCKSDTKQVEVSVLATPEAPVLNNTDAVCAGSSIDLSILNPVDDVTYEWFKAGTSESVGIGNSITIDNVSTEDSEFYAIAYINSCPSTPSDVISLEVSEPLEDEIFAGDDLVVCENTAVLGGSVPFSDNALWEKVDPNNGSIIVTPGIPETIIRELEEGDNLFTWNLISGACGVTKSDTVNIRYEPAPVAFDDEFEVSFDEDSTILEITLNDDINSDNYAISIVTAPEGGDLTINADGTITYVKKEGFFGEDSFTYQLCNTNCPDQCSEASVFIDVQVQEDDQNMINVFTPNGDGMNDAFVIPLVDLYEYSVLKVYNRWGDTVFETDNYKNDWIGTWNGLDLPVGTYYYACILNDGKNTVLKGFIYVQR